MKNILVSESGFTLVELLGVVAIIAVLAVVAVTSINGSIRAGRESAANRQLQTLNSAYQSYLAAGGSVPAPGTWAGNVVIRLGNTINVAGIPFGPFLPNGANLFFTRANGATGNIVFIWNAGFIFPPPPLPLQGGPTIPTSPPFGGGGVLGGGGLGGGGLGGGGLGTPVPTPTP